MATDDIANIGTFYQFQYPSGIQMNKIQTLVVTDTPGAQGQRGVAERAGSTPARRTSMARPACEGRRSHAAAPVASMALVFGDRYPEMTCQR